MVVCYCVRLTIPTNQSLPLLHLQFDVDALFLQKLPLGVVPVLWLPLLLDRSAALSLQPGLLRVVEPEHVVLAHDDAIACHGRTVSQTLSTQQVVSTVHEAV